MRFVVFLLAQSFLKIECGQDKIACKSFLCVECKRHFSTAFSVYYTEIIVISCVCWSFENRLAYLITALIASRFLPFWMDVSKIIFFYQFLFNNIESINSYNWKWSCGHVVFVRSWIIITTQFYFSNSTNTNVLHIFHLLFMESIRSVSVLLW